MLQLSKYPQLIIQLLFVIFLFQHCNHDNPIPTLAQSPPSTHVVEQEGQQELTALGKFSILPAEVVEYIFSYVENAHILNSISLNRSYYQLITGYEFTTPNLVGVEHRSNHITVMGRTRWTSNKDIDFNDLSYTPETIPSCGFYLFVGKARSLPQAYWPYLSGTSVHTVDLIGNNIGAQGAEGLAKHLQGTSVHTVDLIGNNIGAQGAEGLAKHLQGTSVHTVDLSNNNIGDQGAEGLAKHLQGTSVHTVDLSWNNIGAQGAEGLAKHLQGTSVHTVDLIGNNIGDQGAEGLAKHLQGTSVHTVDLRWNENEIEDETRKLLKE